MRNLLLIVFFLAIPFLQFAFSPVLEINGVAPNLVLLISLSYIVLRKPIWPIIASACLLDILTGLPFGLVSLSFVVVVFSFDQIIRGIVSIDGFWLQSGLIGVASMAYRVMTFFLAWIFGFNLVGFGYMMIVGSLYDMILAVICFYGTKVFCKKRI